MKRTKGYKIHSLEQFRSSAYLSINKRLITAYGPDMAVFLANLIDKYFYFRERKMLTPDQFYFLTQDQLTEQTGLSDYQLRKCKEKLIGLRILQVKKYGTPPKIYYKINEETLINNLQLLDTEQLSKNLRINIQKTSKLNKEPKIKDNIKNYNKKITKDQFPEFWKIYPNKASKGQTLKAWEKICSKSSEEKPTWVEIETSIEGQKKSDLWKDPKMIAHGSTWLNQSRWLNDPTLMLHPSSYDRTETLSTKKPLEIIKDYFPDSPAMAKSFYKNYFIPFSNYIDYGSDSELAEKLIKLYHYLKTGQTQKAKNNWVIPNPEGLLDKYITWLTNETWIKEKTTESITNPRKGIFSKFLQSIKKEILHHPLTGEHS